LRNGCEVHLEVVDYMGMTALMWAALGGHTACVKLLLELGSIAQTCDRSGRNAEAYAVANNNQECAKLLAVAIASTADVCNSSVTPIVIAGPSFVINRRIPHNIGANATALDDRVDVAVPVSVHQVGDDHPPDMQPPDKRTCFCM
jgi:ankyrin repeat protein